MANPVLKLIRKKKYEVKTRVKKADRIDSINREQWLLNLSENIVPRLEEITSKSMPKFNISVGFPSRSALSRSKRRIGECWDKVVCLDGTHQIMISPLLGSQNIMGVTATVAHELAHAIVGSQHGHKAPFGLAVRPLGLIGKLTATEAGPEFIKWMDPILAKLGPYAHAGMQVNPKFRAEGTRQLKVECPEKDCGFITRITRKWLDDEEYGAPWCPKHEVPLVEA